MGSEERVSSLCANGCGFFGSPATMDLCSVCYKAYCAKTRQTEDQADQAQLRPIVALPDAYLSRLSPPVVVSSLPYEASPAPAVKNRCNMCRRRVGLTGFVCRCGSTFCGAHRYPEKHKCEHNFKAKGREDIAKANPVVMKDKLEDRL